MASEELKASFTDAAKSKETLEKWLKDQGSDASVVEVAKFLQEQFKNSGEVSDDDLENVAGGSKYDFVVFVSKATFGAACTTG